MSLSFDHLFEISPSCLLVVVGLSIVQRLVETEHGSLSIRNGAAGRSRCDSRRAWAHATRGHADRATVIAC